MNSTLSPQPQLTTSSRLLKLGETIQFNFNLPTGMTAGDFEIFPRYLEAGDPVDSFTADGSLTWLNGRPKETYKLICTDNRAQFDYIPKQPGSYLARWHAGGETFYRYFSAIEDDWVVLRFSSFIDLEVTPTLHATGIPLDYRLPAEQFRQEDPLFQKFSAYHRHFGDTIIPAFPDTPNLNVEERVAQYRPLLDNVRRLLPDPSDGRTARIDMRHDLDTGYTETLMRLGVNEHCGLNEANAKPWLGMPEFPYFSSPVDCRKAAQSPGATVLAHQWDFCGGWHFLGPVSWHYKAAEGDWKLAEKCLHQGFAELANLAQMSGHPAFAVPLYDGLVGAGYPNPAFAYHVPESRKFNGAVADAFMINRALTSAEVSTAMKQGCQNLPELLFHRSADISRDKPRGNPQIVQSPAGKAMEFNGIDDALDTDKLATPTGADFTMGCWVKPGRQQSPWANLISTHNDSGGRFTRGISLEQDGAGTNRFYMIFGDGTGWCGTNVTTQLNTGEWQFFVAVKQGKRLIHYLDGKQVAEGEVPDITPVAATDPVTIADWARGRQSNGINEMGQFVERYQRFMAFELPSKNKVVYARSIDISDYYRRHFQLTPRTIFVSRSDHLLYDMWWLCNWCNNGVLVPRDELPWDTSISGVMQLRNTVHPFKDPLSREYVLVEDHRHSIRFERGCPNPIWWFDYTRQERDDNGSAISHTVTPDVFIRRSGWEHDLDGNTINLRMETSAEFQDYAICLWGVPVKGKLEASQISTNAREFVIAHNTEGEYHLVLFFDLRPGAEIKVTIHQP